MIKMSLQTQKKRKKLRYKSQSQTSSLPTLCPLCSAAFSKDISHKDKKKLDHLLTNIKYYTSIVPDSLILQGKSKEDIVKLAAQEWKSLLKLREENKTISDLRQEITDKNTRISETQQNAKDFRNKYETANNEINQLKSKSFYIGSEQEQDLAQAVQSAAQGTLDEVIPNDKSHMEDMKVQIK